MNKFFVAAFYTLLSAVGTAQRKEVDSLLKALDTEKSDSNKGKIYRQLGNYYTDNNNKKAISYYDSALAISKHLNRPLDIANNYYSIGYCYRAKSDYVRSLANYIESAALYEKLKENRKLTNAFISIAIVHEQTNNTEKTNDYLNKAQQLIELSGDSVQLSYLFNQKGQYFDHRKEYDSALFYYSKTYDISTALNSKMEIASALSNIGLTYKHQHKTEKAIQYFNRVIQLMDTADTPPDMFAVTYNNLASAQSQAGNFVAAEKAFDKSNFWAVKAAFPRVILENYRNMADMYGNTQDYKQQVYYLQKYYALNDSLYTSDTKNQLTELEADYQINQKNAQITQQHRVVEKQKNERNILLTIALAIALLLITALIFYKRIRKKNELLIIKNEQINQQKDELQHALTVLKKTQTQLIQSEKMASLGDLTAGIAHEIQNPLNFVNNFSEVSKELLAEMKEELDNGNIDDAKEIAADVIQNLEKVNYHGKRADAIVKGMLQHSKSSSGQKEFTNINALADEYLRLAYHGLRAKDKSFNALLKTDYDPSTGNINIIPQDIGRVILNLVSNAFYAVGEKQKQWPQGYEPTVSISTKQLGDKVEVQVADNGNGISQNIIDKIFQPFFTTKPAGQGTGLGLSLAYDIVKAHGGEIKVDTKEGEGTIFKILIPQNYS